MSPSTRRDLAGRVVVALTALVILTVVGVLTAVEGSASTLRPSQAQNAVPDA